MAASLRKDKTEKLYQTFLKENKKRDCPFCEKESLIKEYKEWIILANRFPYDKVSEKHDMLVVTRHISEVEELNKSELAELSKIVKEIHDDYTFISLNMPKGRTIPRHLHFHLIKIL